jgi:hypothetical protein
LVSATRIRAVRFTLRMNAFHVSCSQRPQWHWQKRRARLARRAFLNPVADLQPSPSR